VEMRRGERFKIEMIQRARSSNGSRAIQHSARKRVNAETCVAKGHERRFDTYNNTRWVTVQQ
jgi:hypothetical protein